MPGFTVRAGIAWSESCKQGQQGFCLIGELAARMPPPRTLGTIPAIGLDETGNTGIRRGEDERCFGSRAARDATVTSS